MIIYDIKCENGHTFEGWFHDRQAWMDQNARRLVCCPVCNSSRVELSPSSLTILGKDSKPPREKEDRGLTPGQVLQSMRRYLEDNFEDVGNKFAEVALKIHQATPLVKTRVTSSSQCSNVSKHNRFCPGTLTVPGGTSLTWIQ